MFGSLMEHQRLRLESTRIAYWVGLLILVVLAAYVIFRLVGLAGSNRDFAFISVEILFVAACAGYLAYILVHRNK